MMTHRIASGLILALASAALLAHAQPPREFEVASVKLNTLDDRIVTYNLGPGNRFSARGYTLVLLIQRAYGIMDWNVTGGPAWIRTARFDVVAKAPGSGNLTEARLRPMLQSLLSERFKLAFHMETREMPGHALVVAKGGPKLERSGDSEEHPDTFRFNATGLTGDGVTMRDFARFVAGKLGLVAIDQTGLTGTYRVKAEWRDPAGQPGISDSEQREDRRAIVFAAIEQQLGLKFRPQKIPVETLAIHSVQKATEN